MWGTVHSPWTDVTESPFAAHVTEPDQIFSVRSGTSDSYGRVGSLPNCGSTGICGEDTIRVRFVSSSGWPSGGRHGKLYVRSSDSDVVIGSKSGGGGRELTASWSPSFSSIRSMFINTFQLDCSWTTFIRCSVGVCATDRALPSTIEMRSPSATVSVSPRSVRAVLQSKYTAPYSDRETPLSDGGRAPTIHSAQLPSRWMPGGAFTVCVVEEPVVTFAR